MKIKKNLVKEISYERMKAIMSLVGLNFGELSFQRSGRLGWVYTAKARGEKEKITFIDGAVHKDFSATENTPNKAIKKLWDLLTNNKIWLGKYSEYHSVIEWDKKEENFIQRKITSEEDDKVNGIL